MRQVNGAGTGSCWFGVCADASYVVSLAALKKISHTWSSSRASNRIDNEHTSCEFKIFQDHIEVTPISLCYTRSDGVRRPRAFGGASGLAGGDLHVTAWDRLTLNDKVKKSDIVDGGN